MSLFIKMLEELERTMLKYAKQDAVLSMSLFVNDNVEEEDKHFCGYAACVLGAQAIEDVKSQNSLFLKPSELPVKEDISSFINVANIISSSLNRVCSLKFGISFISSSIWSSGSNARCSCAYFSCLFTREEIECIPHLNKEYPTAQDAADYIRIIINKLEEK